MARKASIGNLENALKKLTPPPAQPVEKLDRQPTAARPDREGMALVGAHLPARYSKAMRMLSAETDKSQRELIQEAIDMLLVRYGSKN